jgi:predicted DNA-binding transcriptional regulator YafY
MDKFDRIFHLHAMLNGRRTAIAVEDLLARLECSRPTLYRAINTLKDQLGAPIIFDGNAGGYRYAPADGSTYELPGLWFTPAELHALAVFQRLLKDIGGGLLEEHIGPISRRLEDLVRHRKLNLSEAAGRLRFPAIAARPGGLAFEIVASATLQRRKLWLEYHARGTDERSERTVSPQRLIHYRESWYLDVWDETRNGLRTFSVDRIIRPTIIEQRAVDLPEAELDEYYASAYGIFGGKADRTAVLRFSKERARWVANERWHPQQQGAFLPDGSYELRVPYRDSRELVMDVLRHAAEVEVLEPQALRDEVAGALRAALQKYDSLK